MEAFQDLRRSSSSHSHSRVEIDFEDIERDTDFDDPKYIDHPGRVEMRSILVAYGSETGTAEELAHKTADLCRRLRFRTDITEMDSVDPMLQFRRYTCVLMVVATHGDGDMPYNARKFWGRLKDSRLDDHDKNAEFVQTKYAVFGVGDRKYPKFNWAARKLGKRLKEVGLGAILETEDFAIGDFSDEEDFSTLSHFDYWLEKLEESLNMRYPIPPGQTIIPPGTPLQPYWRLAFVENVPLQISTRVASLTNTAVDDRNIPTKDAFRLVVEKNDRATATDHDKDIRHIAFEKSGPIMEYGPFDCLSIMPKNFIADVNALMEQQGWLDVCHYPVKFEPTHIFNYDTYPHPPITPDLLIPQLTTYTLFTHYLDIMGIASRRFLEKIAPFASKETHKSRLLSLCESENLDEYYDYVTRNKRSMIEVLKDLPSVRIPFYWICDVFPTMRPRQFSIASGGDLKIGSNGRTRFELLVSIVKGQVGVLKRNREGLCSRYLASLKPGMTIDAVLRETTFNITPEFVDESSVMVCVGTGLAPIRALLYEYAMWSRTAPRKEHPRLEGAPIHYMIQGHQRPEKDWLCHIEWGQNILPHLPITIHAAFSRDENGNPQKASYVQDIILKNDYETVANAAFSKEGNVFICGSAGNFVKSVEQSIKDSFVKSQTCPTSPYLTLDAEAEALVNHKKKNEEWFQEVW